MKVVELYYCSQCRGIITIYIECVETRQSIIYTVEENGRTQIDTAGIDSNIKLTTCGLCNLPLDYKDIIKIPYDIFVKIMQRMKEDNKTIYNIELENVSRLLPEEIKEVFVAALL